MIAAGGSLGDKSWSRWAAPLVVLICGIGAYCNCFVGPFVHDDLPSIVDNPQIRRLAPHVTRVAHPTSTLEGRPVSEYTFQLEYAVAGYSAGLMHTTNLVIHLGCGLLLYGIVRRNLANRAFWGERFAGRERWLAATVATVWVVHPLDTIAVTYIVQRVESLAALFYLGVIYCLIRWVEDKRALWCVLAVGASALGMASKETMVTAPVIALLYDRTFYSGSFKSALLRHGKLYGGLAATWIIVGLLRLMNGQGESAGFHTGVSVIEYARTQLDVIAHYIRLAIWPVGLVFDSSDWPLTKSWAAVNWGGWLVLLLAIVSAIAVWTKPWLGFVGAWFFVILSPSSSVVPIVTEVISEQRMYLPLMGIVVLVVMGGWILVERWRAEWLGGGLAMLVVGALGWGTLMRNETFGSSEALWRDVVVKRPNNPKGHFGLGVALVNEHRLPEATAELQRALELEPGYHAVVHWLGQALIDQGDIDGAEKFCDRQIESGTLVAPDARFLRGSIRMSRQDWVGAKEDFEKVVESQPDVARAHYSLAIVLEQLQEWKEAEDQFRQTLQIEPGFADASEQLFRLSMMPGGRN